MMENLPQDKIKIDVSFYSSKDKQNLLREFGNSPAKERLEEFIQKGLEINVADFLYFSLLHLENRGNPQYETKEKIRQNMHMALNFLSGWINWDGKTIRIISAEADPANEYREHIGEGIGLAVSSLVHELTPADWNRIVPKPGQGQIPRFDFEIASSGERYIQVENKGCVVANNKDPKDKRIRSQAHSIRKRKKKIKDKIAEGDYPFPAELRYGIIAAIDPYSNAKCWLLDPPAEKIDDNPKRFKLLSRLYFLRDWISFISPNSQIASSLTIRVAELESLADPFIFDNNPLRRKNGEVIKHHSSFYIFQSPPRLSSFFSKKSRVTDGPTGGVVLQISDNYLVFIGIFEDLISLAIMQNFTEIIKYRHPYPGTMKKTIKCVFNHDEFKKLQLPESMLNNVEIKKDQFTFYLPGQHYYTSSGLVFGLLPLKQD